MKPLHALLAALSFGLAASAAHGDPLTIPLGQQPGADISLPERGLSTQEVLRRRGEPVRRHAAIGEPPISRWEYADYSVYFERDRVVHSVRQHRPVAGN